MESSGNIFLDCTNLQQVQESDGGVNATINIMQCVSDTYQDTQESREASLRSFLLLICGGMIFFMQSGFAMMCAGSVRLKNVQNTMLKNLLDACGAALAFYFVGTSQNDIGNENCRIELSRFASVLTFFRLSLVRFFSFCFYRPY